MSWGYEHLYQHFKEELLYELVIFFGWIVKKGVDPDDFLAGCLLLGIADCESTYPYLKDLPDNPVLLSRPQD